MEFQKKTQKWELQNPLDPEFDEQADGAALPRGSLQLSEFREKPRERVGRVEQRIKKQRVQHAARRTCQRFRAAKLPRDRLRGNVETWKRSGSTGATARDACG